MKKHLLTATGLALAFVMSGCSTAPDNTVPSSDNGGTVATETKAAEPKAKETPAKAKETKKAEPKAKETPAKAKETKKAEPKKKAKPATQGTALAALQTLQVKGSAPTTGYERDAFGASWDDVNGNGCDTRNDILARDLSSTSVGSNCKVQTGVLADPYTATTINFNRSSGNGGGIDIDHVVALSAAWKTGAQQWGEAKRTQFANDPLNLLAVEAAANRQKGDKDAAAWLPANKAFRCQYVARQVAVKVKYGAWVIAPEKEAIERVLSSCPNEPLPTDKTIAKVVANKADSKPVKKAEPKQTAPKQESSQQTGGSDVSYKNCTAVKQAGAAPIKVGDPGWSTKFDRDGDGVGCES